MAATPQNALYYGDNLDVLRRHINDDSVDLVYLDPPFKSDQDYNVLFAEQDGMRSAAQIRAFEDTWRWDRAAAEAYGGIVEQGGRVADAMQAFHTFLGPSDMLAYLSMMAPRIVELRRVLKATGSIYLHCDPTAGHYLKMLMDAVFGPANFRNQIAWKRTHAHGGAKRYGPVHDMLLFYSRSEKYVWNEQFTPYTDDYIEGFFRFKDVDGRRYRATILTGPGIRTGLSGKPWRGVNPTSIGRHWAIPGYARPLLDDTPANDTQVALDQLDKIGRILWPKKAGGVPSFKQYLDDMQGVPLQDVWTDIPPISAAAAERLGYPTQKPEALLERIVQASSNPQDSVLDPFCGCGTTIAAAQKLRRSWIGIDVTHLAITLIKHRLQDSFGKTVVYSVIGEPTDLAGARELARQDPYQFQWWALGLVGARPTELRKGADKGIDGRMYFHDEADAKVRHKHIVISVKAGTLKLTYVRDLRGVLEREKAALAALISIETPTRDMRTEAASAGFYESPFNRKKYSRLQLLTIEDLLSDRGLDYPPTRHEGTFKKAPRHKPEAAETKRLFRNEEAAE